MGSRRCDDSRDEEFSGIEGVILEERGLECRVDLPGSWVVVDGGEE